MTIGHLADDGEIGESSGYKVHLQHGEWLNFVEFVIFIAVEGIQHFLNFHRGL